MRSRAPMLPILAELLNELDGFAGDTSDVEEAVALLADVRSMEKDLSLIKSHLEGTIADAVSGKKLSLDWALVEIYRGRRGTWDHELLLSHLAKEHQDPDELVATILKAAGINYWRTGALKDMGIDPGAYSEWESTKPSIKITENA